MPTQHIGGCAMAEAQLQTLQLEGDAESARILGIFDELAFVVNLLRRCQKDNEELIKRNLSLEEELQRLRQPPKESALGTQ